MATEFKANQIINGSFGRAWANNELLANAKSFEVKIEPIYEEVNVPGKLGSSRKYMGYKVKGSIKFSKVDFVLAKSISQGFLTGVLPDIKFIGELDDPSAQGSGRISVTGITFDEVALLAYEDKKATEEDFNFEAEEVQWL